MPLQNSHTSSLFDSLHGASVVRDGGDFELDGAGGIAIYENGGNTYALIAALGGDRAQIMQISAMKDAGNTASPPAKK